MKNPKSLRIITSIALLGVALSASVLAETGPTSGAGAAPEVVPQKQGPGPNAQAMRHMRFDQANTPGWTLMTPQERMAHRNRMREAGTYEACKQIQAEHHTAMEARAKERGLTLRAPRQNACDMAKARGWVK